MVRLFHVRGIAVPWAWKGRLEWAIRVAGTGGSLCGFALVGLGVSSALAGDVLSGLWFILLGIFLYHAARQALAAAVAGSGPTGAPSGTPEDGAERAA